MKKQIKYGVVIMVLVIITINVNKKDTQQVAIPSYSQISEGREVKFKNVFVENGDTLYSIALDNITGKYTTDKLIEDTVRLNNLKNNKVKLTPGSYLIIPFYNE